MRVDVLRVRDSGDWDRDAFESLFYRFHWVVVGCFDWRCDGVFHVARVLADEKYRRGGGDGARDGFDSRFGRRYVFHGAADCDYCDSDCCFYVLDGCVWRRDCRGWDVVHVGRHVSHGRVRTGGG